MNIKKLQTKAAELKTFILYLEKNPDSEFINKEVTRLTARKNAILGYMPIEYKNMGYNPILKKEQKQWEKEQGIEKINKQLKALKFILS